MNEKNMSKSIVILCDGYGKIKGIINDEVSLAKKNCIGKGITCILKKENYHKAVNFIKKISDKKVALDCEMTAETIDGEKTLFFSGIYFKRNILIIGTNTYFVLNEHLEEMSRIINEQTNIIRSCIDEKTHIASIERERIEKDLHDSISQTIFSTRVLAELLPDLLQKDPDKALLQAQKIKMLTTESLNEMRRMLLELRPDSFAEEDLGDLLGQLVRSARLRSDLDIQLSLTGKGDPKREVKEAVYRIAQESLNNVIKHADASSVKVLLEYLPDRLVLSIEDDGNGFDVEKVDKNKYGLFIMRERASSIASEVKIKSKKGKGTKIEVECRMGD